MPSSSFEVYKLNLPEMVPNQGQVKVIGRLDDGQESGDNQKKVKSP